MYAAQQAAQQAYAAGISPIAAALPTEATSVVSPEQLAGAAAMGQFAPGAAVPMPPEPEDLAGPAQQGQAPPAEE